jgi:two-component system, NtrC family, sensor histidine kinase HydH
MANLVPTAVSEPQIEPHSEPCAEAHGNANGSAVASARGGTFAHSGGRAQAVQPSPPADEEPEITKRLRAQYAEISELAGGLAHEIRNPLSTLSLNLDLLAEDFQDAESPRDRRVLKRVERLQHEVQRLYGIVENFLRFARVQDLKLEPTDLNVVVDELRDFYEPNAASRGIVIRTQFAADLPLGLIDVDLFKQAILNLVLNADHAMPSGGELILTTRREDPWIVLDVIDTGQGMTDEVRARIFDAFFSTRPAGSGLGLPTTRKIVESHGGTIHVRSDPGKGSQFTIRLPVCDGCLQVQRAPASDGFPPPPSFNPG